MEKAKEDSNYHIGKITEKNFEYYRDFEITTIYIKFDKHYDFISLPSGFDYTTANFYKESLSNNEEDIVYGDRIKRTIYYFDNNF